MPKLHKRLYKKNTDNKNKCILVCYTSFVHKVSGSEKVQGRPALTSLGGETDFTGESELSERLHHARHRTARGARASA